MSYSGPRTSLHQLVCGWDIYESMQNIVKNNQLQFTSSCFMRLPTEIVKHVGDAAAVPVSIGDKTCRSSLDNFNLVFLVSLVWTPDSRIVVQVGPDHSKISLSLGSSLACRRLRRRKPNMLLDF